MIEREFKRYIPEEVSELDIMDFIRLRYPISNFIKQEVFDAYFKLNSPESYALRVREIDGELEPVLKSVGKKRTKGLFKRTEEHRIEKICEILNIEPVENLTEFVKNLQQKYGIEFIIKQVRNKFTIDGVEISLDTVEYFYPSCKAIPPVIEALGESYKRKRIFEAEIKESSFEKTAGEITNQLYQEGLLGEVCTLSKKEIGEIPLI